MGTIARVPPPSLPLPDPPLADHVIRLRPWGTQDAPALAAAWADPDIQRWSAGPAPDRRSARHAAHWISHEAGRRRAGLAIDLVISPADPHDDSVLGEVGLAPIDWEAMTADIGWWIAADARRQGLATRAVTLLAGWAVTHLGLTPVAVVDPANRASVRVAERVGVERREPGADVNPG